MKNLKFYIRLSLICVLAVIMFENLNAQTKDSLELYTPYTKIAVPPGKSVSYSIDVINNGSVTRNENIVVSNIPRIQSDKKFR